MLNKMTLRALARRRGSSRIAGSTVGTEIRPGADWRTASILHTQQPSEAMVCVEGWLLQHTHTHTQRNHNYSCSLRSATTALSSYGVFDWWMPWLLLWDGELGRRLEWANLHCLLQAKSPHWTSASAPERRHPQPSGEWSGQFVLHLESLWIHKCFKELQKTTGCNFTVKSTLEEMQWSKNIEPH